MGLFRANGEFSVEIGDVRTNSVWRAIASIPFEPLVQQTARQLERHVEIRLGGFRVRRISRRLDAIGDVRQRVHELIFVGRSRHVAGGQHSQISGDGAARSARRGQDSLVIVFVQKDADAFGSHSAYPFLFRPRDKCMPQSTETGSLTYKQLDLLSKLLERRQNFNAPWFEDLKNEPAKIHMLSAQAASDYIQALDEKSDDGAGKPRSESVGFRPITPKQRSYLSRLIRETDRFDADWFDPLKRGDRKVDSLSSDEASEFISALRGGTSTDSDSERETRSERARQPASEEQLDYILNLLEEKEVARDSLIEVDALLDRLTFSTASHFIDTLKYMPGVDAQE